MASPARVLVVVACLLAVTACSGSNGGSVNASSDSTAVHAPEAPAGTDPTSTTAAPTTASPPSTARPAPTTSAPPPRPTSPSTLPASPPGAQGSLGGKTVVLDPGHNEHNAAHPTEINQQVDIITGVKACDTTGTATNDGYPEAAFTTDVVARAAQQLRALGATVVITRDASTPWGPCITQRAAIGNQAHADVAVSVHADGGPSGGRGFHVIRPGLVAGHNDAIIAPSAAFATVLHDTYAAETGLPPATYVGVNGYDTRTDLGGLNLSTVPKVFIECANMRNATDAAFVKGEATRARIAQAIADGIDRYLAG